MKTKSFKIVLFIIFVFVTTIINAQTVTSTEVFTLGNYESSDVSSNKNYIAVTVTNVNNGNGLSKTLEKQADGSFTLVNTFDLLKGGGSSDAVQYPLTTISNSGISFVVYKYGWSGDYSLIRLQKNLPDGSSITIFEYVNDGIATMKAIGDDLYCVFGAGANFDPGTLGGLPTLSGGYYLLKVNGTTNQYEWSTFLGNSFVWNYDIEIIENPNDPNNIYLTWANGDLQKFSKSNGADLGSVKSGNNSGDKYKFDENGNLNLLTQLSGYNGATLLIYDKNDNFNSVIYKTDWHQANLWNYGMHDWRIINGILYGVNGGRNFYLDDKLIHGYICNQTSNIDSYGWVAGQTINDDGSYSYIMINSSIINVVTATYPSENQSLTPTLNDSDPNIVAVVDGQIYDETNWIDAYHQGTIVFADGTLPAIGDTPDASWVNVPDGTHLLGFNNVEQNERAEGGLIFRMGVRKDGTGSDDINLKVLLVEESDVVLSVEDVEDNDITVYPNPVDDVLYISSEFNIENIVIYDVAGRVVSNTYGVVPSHTIDVCKLKNGVYFLKINTEQTCFFKSFVKK